VARVLRLRSRLRAEQHGGWGEVKMNFYSESGVSTTYGIYRACFTCLKCFKIHAEMFHEVFSCCRELYQTA
jgi:hypothetical protein